MPDLTTAGLLAEMAARGWKIEIEPDLNDPLRLDRSVTVRAFRHERFGRPDMESGVFATPEQGISELAHRVLR